MISLEKPAHLLLAATYRTRLIEAKDTKNTYAIEWIPRALATHRTNTAAIDALIQHGEANGWTAEWRAARQRNTHRCVLAFTRSGDEFLDLDVDSSSASVVWVRGRVATGPVSSHRVDSHHHIRFEELAGYLSYAPRAAYPDTEWVLVVGPGYVERREYETAGNYSEYRVTPGVYPVEITDSNGRPALAGADGRWGYWAEAVAPSVKFHDYYVNRLGSASSLSESWEESASATYMRIYASNLTREDRPRELPADLARKAVYIRRAELPADIADRLADGACFVCGHGPHADSTTPEGGHMYWSAARAADYAARQPQATHSPDAAYVTEHRPG